MIGLVQSAYPVGSLLGCLVAPRLVIRVGHVRVFGALASLASTAALIHLVTYDPWSWGAVRMLAGFCFAGLYVVAESWLNGRATNESRGSLLSSAPPASQTRQIVAASWTQAPLLRSRR